MTWRPRFGRRPAPRGDRGAAAEAAGAGGAAWPPPDGDPAAVMPRFRTPPQLEVTATVPERILLVGSCMLESFPDAFRAVDPRCRADLWLLNNLAPLPARFPFGDPAEYQLQVVQVPICSLLPEQTHLRLAYDDVEGYAALFEATKARLDQFLHAALGYCRELGLLTCVANFLLPQENPIGRLQPKADLRDLRYFVGRLNEHLHRTVDRLDNAHVLDLDAIAASLGRRHVQDDVVWSTSHGSVLTDWDHDRDLSRLEVPARLSDAIPFRSAQFVREACEEAIAVFRTVHQVDAVKLVIIDLDDTLWRGVVAEEEDVTLDTWAGWPMGVVEALLTLKRRGVMLAVVSRNDRERIERLLPDIFCDVLQWSDFASVQVNWEPKVRNVERVLRETNVLPGSAVFIDDNPTERAAVKAAFPGIRILGDQVYDTRRILLWAAETQVASITAESGRRTEMVQAQIRRDEQRACLAPEEFFARLGIRVHLDEVRSIDAPQLTRALQLVNRTNQFNSTGERWTAEAARRLLTEGGSFVVASVEDNFTAYGLTAVAVLDRDGVRQLVMSCRVVGLKVEAAVLAELEARARARGLDELRIGCRPTGKNALVLGALEANGYADTGTGTWCKRLVADRLVDRPVEEVTVVVGDLLIGAWGPPTGIHS